MSLVRKTDVKDVRYYTTAMDGSHSNTFLCMLSLWSTAQEFNKKKENAKATNGIALLLEVLHCIMSVFYLQYIKSVHCSVSTIILKSCDIWRQTIKHCDFCFSTVNKLTTHHTISRCIHLKFWETNDLVETFVWSLNYIDNLRCVG